MIKEETKTTFTTTDGNAFTDKTIAQARQDRLDWSRNRIVKTRHHTEDSSRFNIAVSKLADDLAAWDSHLTGDADINEAMDESK